MATDKPICMRNMLLYQALLGKTTLKTTNTSGELDLKKDMLLDALLVLYDECSRDSLKNERHIKKFVGKFDPLVNELRQLRVNINDFEVKKAIGRGHFGEVHLVQEKRTGDVYAMKIMKKNDILAKQTVAFYEEERNIMAKASSEWITALHYAFQDEQNLYLVMDYHPGGNLLSLMDRQSGMLTEDTARFYLAEIIQAIHSLHSMGYVHRDIKPENILLDRLGHVKLADFGSSAKLTAAAKVDSEMPVGTPDYIAPEVLMSLNFNGTNYGVECDYWSVGVLAYEMLFGETPFTADTTTRLYSKIMNAGEVKFPETVSVSPEFKDLIVGLLREASRRLTYADLISHPFFKSVDWEDLRNTVPPHIPSLSSQEDTSNFEEYPVSKRDKTTLLDSLKTSRSGFSGVHLPFVGFTFVQQSVSSKLEVSSDASRELEKKNREIRELEKKIDNYEKDRAGVKQLENLRKKTTQLEQKLLEERKIAAQKTYECNAYKDIMEKERNDRMEVERKTVEMVRTITNKWTKNLEDQGKELEEMRLHAEKLLLEVNSLTTQLSAAKDDYQYAQQKIAALQKKVIKYKGIALRTQQLNDRRSSFAAGPNELRLKDQLAAMEGKIHEENEAKNQLNAQVLQLKKEMENITKNNATKLNELEDQYKKEIKEKEAKFKKNEKELQDKLVREKELRLKELEQQLDNEIAENSKLKNQINQLNKSLNDSLQQRSQFETSFSVKEAELETKLKQLEQEMRQALETKLELQEEVQARERREAETVQTCELLHRQLQEALEKVEKKQDEMDALLKNNSVKETQANANEKLEYVENQMKKLEEQLEKARESLTLEREKTRQIQTNLWKKEKELSDAKIDLRISNREKKTAEDELAKLQNSQTKHADQLQEKENAIGELQKDVEKLKTSLEELNGRLLSKDEEISKLNGQMDELRSKAEAAADHKLEIERLKTELQLLERQKKVLESEAKFAEERGEQRNKQMSDLVKKEEEWKNKYIELDKAYQELRGTCSMMDEQMEEFQKIIDNYESKETGFDQEKIKLQQQMEQLQSDLRSAKQQINEEKSLKLFSESKLRDLESRLKKNEDSAEGYIADLKKQLTEATMRVETLQQQVSELSKQLADAETAVLSTGRRVGDLESENLDLKEEAAELRTQLVSLRNSKAALNQGLEEAISKGEGYKTRVQDLEAEMESLKALFNERDYKSKLMSAQQLKLIEHLQSKVEEKDKKKKTLAGKLFGNKKENQTPVSHVYKQPETPVNRRREAAIERELFQKETHSEKRPVSVPLAQKELAHLTQSPGAQGSPATVSNLAIQRMRHNIPHRLQQHMIMRATNCAVCLDTIHFGRYASFCQECGATTHSKCASHLPSTCGLPQGLAQHFGAVLGQEKPPSGGKKTQEQSEAPTQMEGWVKVPKPGKACWERKYLKLISSDLCVFDHEPNNQSMEAIDKLELQPKDSSVVTIHAAVTNSEIVTTAKSDLPYIFMVEVTPLTTCWPGRNLLVMAPTFPEKKNWISALEAVSQGNVQRPPSASVVLKMDKDKMDVNCAEEIDNKILLGAAEGLFVYNTQTKSLVKIEGVVHVQQIQLVPVLGLAFFIIGLERKLVCTDLNVLKRLADSAQCVKPTVQVDPVENLESCHLFSVQALTIESAYLCAATQDRVKFFKWHSSSNGFVLRKELNVSETCSCIWFTRNSVIIGCDRFYEADLIDFTVEEFLDASDKSLAHVVFGLSKLRSFPVAILDVTTRRGDEEYLLCYHEFGIFVDAYGRRSRLNDVKWTRLPLAFAYKAPYLYVIHFNSVEIMLLTADSFNAKNDSSSDNLSEISSKTQASVFIELPNPRYLGACDLTTQGSVYVFTNKQSEIEIVKLDGKQFLKDSFYCDSDSYSVASSDADISITSSIIEAATNLSSVSSGRIFSKRSLNDNDRADKRVKFESDL